MAASVAAVVVFVSALSLQPADGGPSFQQVGIFQTKAECEVGYKAVRKQIDEDVNKVLANAILTPCQRTEVFVPKRLR